MTHFINEINEIFNIAGEDNSSVAESLPVYTSATKYKQTTTTATITAKQGDTVTLVCPIQGNLLYLDYIYHSICII